MFTDGRVDSLICTLAESGVSCLGMLFVEKKAFILKYKLRSILIIITSILSNLLI